MSECNDKISHSRAQTRQWVKQFQLFFHSDPAPAWPPVLQVCLWGFQRKLKQHEYRQSKSFRPQIISTTQFYLASRRHEDNIYKSTCFASFHPTAPKTILFPMKILESPTSTYPKTSIVEAKLASTHLGKFYCFWLGIYKQNDFYPS